MQEAASPDYVGLIVLVSEGFGRSLGAQIYFSLLCGNKTSIASREERSYRLVGARVVLVEGPLLPGLVRGFISDRQPFIVKTINDGGPHRPDVG